MEENKIKLQRKLLECKHCGHQWFESKKGNKCGKCPVCHNDYYKPRKRKKEENKEKLKEDDVNVQI